MKESARAARDERAHARCVAALKKIPEVTDEQVEALAEARRGRKSPAVRATHEREIMADILEELASGASPAPVSDYPSEPLDESTVHLLADAGYDTLEAVREASDENLLAIKGIGDAKLAEIRAKVG